MEDSRTFQRRRNIARILTQKTIQRRKSVVSLFVKNHLFIRKRTKFLKNATTLMGGSHGFCIRMKIKDKTAELNGRWLYRRKRFSNWRIHNEFVSKVNPLEMLAGGSRRLVHRSFLISRHDFLPSLSFLSFP
jgi:hypothetical protein